MLDRIILLTGAAERPIFTSLLSTHNPCLTIIPAETLADLTALKPDTLARARLIAFVTGVIVPAELLHQLGYGAYNFHAGPPTYPGWAPAHFALYERATKFGATAHVMVDRVDEGPIVGVATFPIPPGVSVASLEGMAYARLAHLFWTLAKPLATGREWLPHLPLRWSGRKSTRRDYAALCDVPLDIQRDELDHRIEVFGEDPNFGTRRISVASALRRQEQTSLL
jgi:methionyl-tRNA formyltransferase